MLTIEQPLHRLCEPCSPHALQKCPSMTARCPITTCWMMLIAVGSSPYHCDAFQLGNVLNVQKTCLPIVVGLFETVDCDDTAIVVRFAAAGSPYVHRSAILSAMKGITTPFAYTSHLRRPAKEHARTRRGVSRRMRSLVSASRVACLNTRRIRATCGE